MFEWLSQSIWGYPIIAAAHVLGIAWFGAAAWGKGSLHFKRTGQIFMLASGLLLFFLHPGMYFESTAFRLKLALLLVLGLPVTLDRKWTVTLWVAVLFASRGIAFF